jgi:hypothetical protein
VAGRFRARVEWAGVNAGYLTPIIFAGLSLWFLYFPTLRLAGAPIDDVGAYFGLMLSEFCLLMACFEARKMLRRKGLPNSQARAPVRRGQRT